MKTVVMKVAYKGTQFCGFARQPHVDTVQGEIERALSMVFRREVLTVCAGRTDAGVHALGQMVSFELEDEELDELIPQRLVRSMNALTADDIAIKEVHKVPQGFSARFDAKAREYRYYFCIDEQVPVFMKEYSWHTGSLDANAMEQASRYLLGEHDFKSFCVAASAVDKPTCRDLIQVSFHSEEVLGEHFLVMRIIGSSFLHSMVRTIAGTLVSVGKGKRSPEWVTHVLEAKDRTAAGECAPACGLFFWEVFYG